MAMHERIYWMVIDSVCSDGELKVVNSIRTHISISVEGGVVVYSNTGGVV